MDDPMYRSGYRPLAPKVGADPPTPNRGAEDNRSKRSSTACSECKQRRIKVLQRSQELLSTSLPPARPS
ncbi:hypothetical protein BJX64DRAFT_188389 [Aspergillus heterothallicus]